MNIEKKLAVFVKVANILNENKIVWAAGGSFLLYIKGIANEFNDYDIMILESEAEHVKLLLNEYSTMKPPISDAQYRSNVFFEYVIDEVDFDFIAGFTIVKDDIEHCFPLEQKNINDFTYIHDTSIPLQSVDEWEVYYTLLGKTKKMETINLWKEKQISEQEKKYANAGDGNES